MRTSTRRIFWLVTTDRFISSTGMGRSSLPENEICSSSSARSSRAVEPREEELFFAGYGPVDIDPEALIYYRYERVVQDLGEIGQSVLLEPNRSDRLRAEESRLARSFFAPGGDIDHAEAVTLRNFHRDQ
jgi:hypothetical protein